MINPEFHFSLRVDLEALCVVENDKTGGKLKASDFLPTKAEPEATGYDVRCAVDGGINLKPGCYVKIPLGFRMFAPKNWWLSLSPRSGTFAKRHIHALYGVIDECFEAENMFIGQYIPDACDLLNSVKDPYIAFGERIAQLIPIERKDMLVKPASPEEIEKMYSTRNAVRKTGGFGSTGAL